MSRRSRSRFSVSLSLATFWSPYLLLVLVRLLAEDLLVDEALDGLDATEVSAGSASRDEEDQDDDDEQHLAPAASGRLGRLRPGDRAIPSLGLVFVAPVRGRRRRLGRDGLGLLRRGLRLLGRILRDDGLLLLRRIRLGRGRSRRRRLLRRGRRLRLRLDGLLRDAGRGGGRPRRLGRGARGAGRLLGAAFFAATRRLLRLEAVLLVQLLEDHLRELAERREDALARHR